MRHLRITPALGGAFGVREGADGPVVANFVREEDAEVFCLAIACEEFRESMLEDISKGKLCES